MRKRPALLVVVHCALLGTAFASLAGEDKTAVDDAVARGREIARIDGTAIRLHELSYDPEQRYKVELHAMEVRLYREQKAVLRQYIDQKLLEQEAAKRNMNADELIAMVTAQAEEKAKTFESDKEVLFQDFVKKMQHDFPSFSKRTAVMQSPGAAGLLSLPAGSAGTPFIEAVKNKVVEMKRAAYVNQAREAFVRGLRDQSRIEILLKRPPLLRLDLTPDDGPWLGSKDAPVTIQSFIDFQCPSCKKASSTLKDLLVKKKGAIRIVARDFPLPSHPDAPMAARAAACADDQDRYWDYHDLLFDNQQALDVASLRGYARQAGLDTVRFDRCLEDDSRSKEVEKDVTKAALAGINSTPGIIINGFYLSGTPSLTHLEEVITAIENGQTPLAEDVP